MKNNQAIVPAETTKPLDIRSRIFTIRGVQVMLDSDLAIAYGVDTRSLNQAVKRNIGRFPDTFRFQLTREEMNDLISQNVISNFNGADPKISTSQIVISKMDARGGRSHLPYAFTEHGILMLASLLRSDIAVQVSVRIMNIFVEMRRALASLAPLLSRLDAVERRQITDQSKNDANQSCNEERFKLILDAMQAKTFPPQKVFFNGDVFDAEAFATKYILSAKKSIVLIDSWVDTITLEMLAKKRRGVTIQIVSSPRGNHLSDNEIKRFNEQYGGLAVTTSRNFHDRFLIVDDKNVYLFGASLKNLGEKCFVIATLDSANIPELKARI